MKKTAIILLVSTILVTSAVGVTATIAKMNHKADTTETTPTQTVCATTAPTKAPTQAPTTVETQAETQAPTVAPTQAPEKAEAAKTSTQNDNYSTFPDITGTWRHNSNDGCTIQVVNQNDNHIEFTIQSCSENASKIATSRLALDLQTYTEGSKTYGEAYFNYSDSFGSGGTGSILVTEDSISLALVKEFDPGASWNVTPAAGDYYFDGDYVDPNEAGRFDNLPENQQIFDHTLPCPELEGFWKSTTNNGASITIVNQNDFDADIIIELHNKSNTKIATAKVPVTFLTDANGYRIGAFADFEYEDSFGSSGTGSIIFDGEIIRLELNEEVGAPFTIAPAAGIFTFVE